MITFETASSLAALDFCAMLSSVWHLDTSSPWLSSDRDFFAGGGFDEPDADGGPPDADDIVLAVDHF